VKCPDCGAAAAVVETLLGGYVKAKCWGHGTFTAMDVPAPMPIASRGVSRRSDPETSRLAAESVDPSGQHAALLSALSRIGEGSRRELSEASGLTEYQAGRRLSELERAGEIRWTGETRPGESGRMQRVWARRQEVTA